MILLIDAAKKAGHDMDDLYRFVNEKMAINKTRKWGEPDEDGVVRHQVVNDLPLGRNIDEMLRMVDALQFHEKNGEVCPANWSEGADGMKPDPKGSQEYFSKHNWLGMGT